MKIKGVADSEQFIIDSILGIFMHKYEFYYYGSRVKGNFRPMSDLDILVKGDVSQDDLSLIKTLFDNSNLPYIVNLTDYNNIDKDFYELIKVDLVKTIDK